MKKNYLLASILLTGTFLSGCSKYFRSTTPTQPARETQLEMHDTLPVDTEEAAMDLEDGVAPQSAQQYIEYSAQELSSAQENGKTVLFFHASWCPSCRAADKDITQNLDEIPEGVTILKTDYDSEKELKKKYGVTSQHTFVQVDSNGEMITKWSGGGLSDVAQNIQ